LNERGDEFSSVKINSQTHLFFMVKQSLKPQNRIIPIGDQSHCSGNKACPNRHSLIRRSQRQSAFLSSRSETKKARAGTKQARIGFSLVDHQKEGFAKLHSDDGYLRREIWVIWREYCDTSMTRQQTDRAKAGAQPDPSGCWISLCICFACAKQSKLLLSTGCELG
jgi:hypothetical protein